LYLAIWSAWTEGDEPTAVALHRRLLPYLSYWMQDVELIVAAEKLISTRRGLIGSDHCRAPMRMLDTLERQVIEDFLDEFQQELGVSQVVSG
jgi:4-hydroxy-tetrahydrodipicolinate synthase